MPFYRITWFFFQNKVINSLNMLLSLTKPAYHNGRFQNLFWKLALLCILIQTANDHQWQVWLQHILPYTECSLFPKTNHAFDQLMYDSTDPVLKSRLKWNYSTICPIYEIVVATNCTMFLFRGVPRPGKTFSVPNRVVKHHLLNFISFLFLYRYKSIYASAQRHETEVQHTCHL